jgi:benzoyl-CoA reductase subunit D
MAITVGIDVGSSAVKTVVMECLDDGWNDAKILHRNIERIRRRNPVGVIRGAFEKACEAAGMKEEDFDYIASTGEGDLVDFRTGHFFGMTTHARGANFLFPETRSVLDLGALHTRAMFIDERSRVIKQQMTGQCASGTGQFLENISRYLGIGIEEVGPLSLKATKPEPISSICAVLSETDVINMVSRGIETPDILRGIHESMASRLTKLIRGIRAVSPLTVTGGLARDVGLIATLRDFIERDGLGIEVNVHPDSIFAGATGAALWGGFRYFRLKEAGN